MKCICDRSALNEALAAASTVIASRTPKPILQCIRITAEKTGVILTAFDNEVGLRYRVQEVEVAKPGEVLVGGDRLSGIVRESSDDTLAFETADNALHVRGRDSHFQIYSQDVREFPPVPDLEGATDFQVRTDVLRQAIERTIFAAARENTRYAINGVLWEKNDGKLTLVATDGRRLALSQSTLEKSSGSEVKAIVPTKAMQVFTRLHPPADEIASVKISGNQVIIKTDRATISSVVVEGRFPNYPDVIPRDADKRIEVDTAEFLSAVKRASLLTNEESKGIRMAVSGEGIVFSCRAPETGEATVRLSVDYKQEPIEIGFNPSFLIDVLKVCGERVTLELQSSSKPAVIKGGPDFKYVVMPVNLS